jgi:thiol-disulfide isomerase/thioredoxin
MRRWLLGVPLLLLLSSPATARKTSGSVGGPSQAPGFSLPARAGIASLDSLRGRVVLVDFWASWCVPCRRSFPWLGALQERYRAMGLTIVAINLDKDREAADEFLEKHPAEFLVAFDPAGKTAEAYRVSAMPSSYLINRSGTILSSHSGFDPKQVATLETTIQEACSR